MTAAEVARQKRITLGSQGRGHAHDARANLGFDVTKTEHMPLTRDFRKTIQERLSRDRGFREALLEEGVTCMLAGEVDEGISLLRAYVKATILRRRTCL